MKKRTKILIGAIASVAVVFSIATYIIGGMVYDGGVGSHTEMTKEEMLNYYSTNKDKPALKLKNYKTEKLFVKSDENGYNIEVLNIKSNKETKDVMVLVHGIESNYYEVLNSAFNYLEHGYNVVVYNQRHTGYTGGDDYTFGLCERYDLDSVVKYAAKAYPDGKLGVHGYSMGAATATMHTQLNEKSKNVDFYILDAPYHTMKSAVYLGIKKKNIPLVPVPYIEWAGDLMIKAKAGFCYDDVQPYEAVKNITVPVMLIHGTADKRTPPESSQIIYDSIPHNKKELWYIKGLGHCVADNEMPDEYFGRIYDFIKREVK